MPAKNPLPNPAVVSAEARPTGPQQAENVDEGIYVPGARLPATRNAAPLQPEQVQDVIHLARHVPGGRKRTATAAGTARDDSEPRPGTSKDSGHEELPDIAHKSLR